MILRQSTAMVISVGPIVSKLDGVTLQTGYASALDHPTTGILLSKNGAPMVVRHAPVAPTVYDTQGCYRCTLDATDTDTLGTLRLIFSDSTTILPVWRDVLIVNQVEWDSQCGAGIRPVNVEQILGVAADIPTTAAIADAFLARNLAGGTDGGRNVASALRSLRNKVSIVGNVMTVYAENDSTPLWTAVLVTSATAKPITEMDPT